MLKSLKTEMEVKKNQLSRGPIQCTLTT